MKFKTIGWKNNAITFIDQTKLPGKEIYRENKTVLQLANSIRELAIRGAPAIGIAAGYGIALSGFHAKYFDIKRAKKHILKDIELLEKTRPTAVNLFCALKRMKSLVDNFKNNDSEKLFLLLLKESKKIHNEDKELCRKIGEYGATLVPQKASVMTHCNAGALATGGWGTALGVIYAAKKKGKKVHVYVGETRPLLQGARLTAWELERNKIPVTILVDSARATLLRNNVIDLVIVGADRIAANGDTANKIGTYPLAVLAKKHSVGFYVAAPSTTFDTLVQTGNDITIEKRAADEVRTFTGMKTAPVSAAVFNPAFDVTPHTLISGIITERGILNKPYMKSIKKYIKSME